MPSPAVTASCQNKFRYAYEKRPNYPVRFVRTNTHESPLLWCLKSWKACRIEATHFSDRRALSLSTLSWAVPSGSDQYNCPLYFWGGSINSLNTAKFGRGGYYDMRWMNVGEPGCGWVQQGIPHCDSAVPPPWILARPNMRMHNYTGAYGGAFLIRYHLGGTLQSDSNSVYNLGDFLSGRSLREYAQDDRWNQSWRAQPLSCRRAQSMLTRSQNLARRPIHED